MLTVSPLNPPVVLENSPNPALSPSNPRLTELSVFRMIWRGSPRELLSRKDMILSISTSPLARSVSLPSSYEFMTDVIVDWQEGYRYWR